MSSQNSLSKVLERPEFRVHRDRMTEHAKYIESKFGKPRGRDIRPEKVEEILKDLSEAGSQLEKSQGLNEAFEYVETILFQCEAALMFHEDKDYARYLETLKKKVLPLLKDI